jgi:uncharacterized membrane protein YeaQ/YmgE (transglycosylase-associated protein family)
MTGKGRLEKKHFVIIAALIVVIGIIGAVTSQWLLAAILIVLVGGSTFVLNRYRRGTRTPDDPEGGEAIIAAVIVTIVGALVSVWLLWAVAIAALLLIQQSLQRIDQRLDALEKR